MFGLLDAAQTPMTSESEPVVDISKRLAEPCLLQKPNNYCIPPQAAYCGTTKNVLTIFFNRHAEVSTIIFHIFRKYKN